MLFIGDFTRFLRKGLRKSMYGSLTRRNYFVFHLIQALVEACKLLVSSNVHVVLVTCIKRSLYHFFITLLFPWYNSSFLGTKSLVQWWSAGISPSDPNKDRPRKTVFKGRWPSYMYIGSCNTCYNSKHCSRKPKMWSL